jgi:hypothetical protein
VQRAVQSKRVIEFAIAQRPSIGDDLRSLEIAASGGERPLPNSRRSSYSPRTVDNAPQLGIVAVELQVVLGNVAAFNYSISLIDGFE